MGMKYLIKIDRIAAWVLLASMFTYFVSGYGMTKGIIDANLALNLHTKYLPTVIILAFALHTPFAIHLALKRWRMWNIFTKSSLILIYVLFVAGFMYYEYFYTRPVTPASTGTTTNTSTQNVTNTTGEDDDDEEGINTQANATPTTNNAGTNTTKTFTTSELSVYNGQNGQPAYVAVDGNVYDVSRLFTGGYHFTHFAGKDLTGEFYSQHAKSKLANYPIIGQLK
jgi:predicted heme/steroid binding protein